MKPFLSVTALGLLLVGTAGAAPKISAQSIIVNPVPTSLNVKVWTDRGSGNQVPGYAPGERIRLYASVNQDAYVYLFNVDPGGRVDLILPNRYQGGANFLKANTARVFPAPGDPFTFDIAAPYGLNKVLALASLTPLNLDQIATFKSQQNSFATVNVQGQERLAQALSIVVNPVEQSGWISATAYYSVVPRTGSAAPLQSPAPVTPAPLTSAPVAAAPVRPVPPVARPLSVTVQPLPTARDWNTTHRSGDLRGLYADYAARLRAEGYTETGFKQAGNHIRGEFRRGNSRATLEVKQKDHRFEVEITRR